MKVSNITELIGKTPLIQLKGTNIYAKLEYFNPLHSVKDRAALSMINEAEKRGDLKPGGTIIEPTSGNTGIGLAYIAKQKGYKVILTMPASMSEERRALLKILGAELVLTPASEGMQGAVNKAKELAQYVFDSYIPSQFTNPDNIKAHSEGTALEIIEDLGMVSPDYLVLTFGTGGTITGIGKKLKEKYPSISIIGVEPYESPLVSKGKAGSHGIQGIGANFVPTLLDVKMLDAVMTVKTEDAKQEALAAAREYGTLIGISSGAALYAAKEIQKTHPSANIVTLFPDTGERYLSVFSSMV